MTLLIIKGPKLKRADSKVALFNTESDSEKEFF